MVLAFCIDLKEEYGQSVNCFWMGVAMTLAVIPPLPYIWFFFSQVLHLEACP